ncbi:MAG: glutamate--tRNA ligase [Candidatus Saccharibacteria bacterium]|nr:glutamate--tRNA ligase [Candidatus Saccharibacteria bacterium]
MSKAVRTRFAPSPTGYLHVGGIRTALFAWLLARQAGGQFVLRLEDTDQKREVEGAAQHISDSLRALGLDYDEGPDKPGDYAPYRQSERLDIYKKWAQKLLDSGRAYADPYGNEEVQKFREQAQKEKKAFLYRNFVSEEQRNDTAWNPKAYATGRGGVPLRFKSDPKAYAWHDEVMGEMSTGPEVVDDFVLIKSDGFPTYNFAHIVDDAEMRISHVIRGQEFLASVPNYLNLYEALKLERPILATMPPIMNEQGNKKLSKRDGAKDILDYLREGYLPEALISFIATLGWNDGTEQEIFTTKELIDKFDLDRVQKGGARFDQRRLLWANGHFIRQMELDELYELVSGQRGLKTGERRTESEEGQSFWPAEADEASEAYKKQVLGLVQERMKYFAELPELTRFFFTDLPVDMSLIKNHKKLKKFDTSELKDLLQRTENALETSDFSADDLQAKLNQLLEDTGHKPAVLLSLIRIATTWAPASPGLAETLAVLGKQKTFARLKTSVKALENS